MNEKYIFSKKKEISPKEVWNLEPQFSKWFETLEGKEYLEEILGIKIASIETEKQVGKYRLDVYAIEEETGNAIIVENQYNTTDHSHLGQVITYAAGLSSNEHPIKHIVWISEESREEAESAVKWLNDVTNSSLNFFLLKPRIYSIGEDSHKIFDFEVVIKPNAFEKSLQKAMAGEKSISPLNDAYLDFWLGFDAYLVSHNISLKKVKARPQKWMFNTPAKNKNVFEIKKSSLGREIAYKFCIYDKELHLRLKEKEAELHKIFGNKHIIFNSDSNTSEWGFMVMSGIEFKESDNVNDYKAAYKYFVDMYKKAEEVQKELLEM